MSAPGRDPIGPPRMARALLEWSLPGPDAPFVLGDLDQRFQERCRVGSNTSARLWYWRQAAAAVRVRGAWPRATSAVRPKREDLAERLASLSRALRVAVRSLARRPGMATVCVLALGLGVGATTTAFSVVWGTVLRGLPFDEADRLIHFERQNLAQDQLSLPVAPHDYLAWRDAQSSFEDLGAFVEAIAQLPTDAGPPTRYSAIFLTANAFDLLRVRPALGRLFSPDEDAPGGPAVAVIGHGLWERHFGADPTLVGREIDLNGRPTTVIGVMPEGFGFPVAEQVWLPLRLDLSNVQRGDGRLDVFGRLREGVSLEQARSEIEGLALRLSQAYPETNDGISPSLQTFQDEYVGEDFTRTVFRMLVGALLVLLVACANVANLLLARARSRVRELAVRTALGAGRIRLLGVLLTEAGVLTAAGAALGVGLAQLGVRWFERSGTQAGVFPLPHGTAPLFWWDVRVDGAALLFVLTVTVLTALAAGLLPGLLSASTNPAATLRSDARGNTGRRLSGASRGLVVGEVALTTGLLVVAGLLLRSVLAATSASDPVRTAGVMTARVSLPLEALGLSEAGMDDHQGRLAFATELARTLALEAGVESAAVTTQLPTQRPLQTPFSLAGATYAEDRDQPSTWVSTVSETFFPVFDVAPSEGRLLGPEDGAGGNPVAVVNQSFAARFFPERSPIDQRIRLGALDSDDPWVTIVGVVPDLWTNARTPEQQTVYVPLSQSATPSPEVRLGRWGLRSLSLAVRTRTDASEAVDLIRGAVYRVNSTVPVHGVRSMADVLDQSTGRYRIWARFYAGFATVALFLAAIGLYGVMSFSVTARSAEIGIRRALGAPRSQVIRGVIGAGLRQVAWGAALGVVIALWLSRGIERMLFQVDAADPAVFAAVLGVVGLVGLLASVIPAGRASSVEPTEALRAD